MKKKALVLAVCMAFATPSISAAKNLPNLLIGLSLGEIQSKSYLNEPFKAIIPILLSNGEQTRNLKVKLAPASVFEKIGAEKLPVLNYLKFRIGSRNYKPVIVVSSNQPIQTPFLNFVLEVQSTEGTLYQDYTALLDPPSYQASTSIESVSLESDLDTNNQTLAEMAKIVGVQTTQAAKHVTRHTATNVEKQTPESETTDLKALSDAAIELEKIQGNLLLSAYSSPRLSSKSPTLYVVRTGDSLSLIAQRLTTGEVSVAKMMTAIHLSNPAAFVNNDINKLRKGAVLHIPTLKEIKNHSKKTAPAIAALQLKSEKRHEINTHASQSIQHGGQSYTVKKGDTLSSIIKKSGYSVGSFTKTLKTVHQANPHAFVNHNINKLISGASLRFPSAETPPIEKRQVISQKKAATQRDVVKHTTPDKQQTTNHVAAEKEFSPKTYVVKHGDTLSQVVREVAYKNVSFTKMMKAIYAANQHAFEKNNITILKEGAILQIPPLQEVLNNAKESNPAKKEATELPVTNENDLNVEQTEKNLKSERSENSPSGMLINNLEKRLRELRRDLAKTKSNLSTLELTMSDKEDLIAQKNRDLDELKVKIRQLESVQTNHEKTVAQQPEVNSQQGNKSISESFDAPVSSSYSGLSTFLGDDAASKIKEAAQEQFKFLSNKDLVYAMLALMLGLVLIRYRKTLYSYVAISYDYPKYYASDKNKNIEAKGNKLSPQQTAELQKEIINFQETLVEQENDKELEINEDFLHECEDLAEGLYQKTDYIETSNDKISNSYIEKLTEEIKKEEIKGKENKEHQDKIEARTKAEKMTLDLFEGLEQEILSDATEATPDVRKETESESKPANLDWKKLLDEADKQLAETGGLDNTPQHVDKEVAKDVSTEISTDPEELQTDDGKIAQADRSDHESIEPPVTIRNGTFETIEMVSIDMPRQIHSESSEKRPDKFKEAALDELSHYDEYCRNQSILEDDAAFVPA